jgi:hypothetical protein
MSVPGIIPFVNFISSQILVISCDSLAVNRKLKKILTCDGIG